MKYINLLLIFSVILISSSTVRSQTNQGNSTRGLGFSTENSNRFFTDEAGLKLLELAAPLDDFIDPETYIVGPLDVLSIYGKGSFEFAYRALVVNANGDLSMPLAGLIKVGGLTITEAKDVIIEAFSDKVKNTEIQVSIDQPKPVAVHVGGDVPLPGKHRLLPGTRFDFLVSGYEAGNQLVIPLIDSELKLETIANPARPSFTGINFERIAAENKLDVSNSNRIDDLSSTYDLRNIEVTRINGNKEHVDLFGYFRSGNIEFNPYLQSGDQITVKTLNRYTDRIGIGGAVQTPFDVSFHDSDNINRLIQIAGGLIEQADTSHVIIKRLNGSIVDDIVVNANEFSSFELIANDRLVVPYLESNNNGAFWIYGEVEYPGIYPMADDEISISEVISAAGGFREKALKNGAYIIRNSNEERGVDNSININLLTRSSDQYLEGFDYIELESALNPNRSPVDLSDNYVLDNIMLRDGDKLYIPSDEKTITILGQVEQPGVYSYDTSLSSSDYLRIAGGVTLAADPNRVIVIKAGSKAWQYAEDSNLQSGDIIFVDRVPFEDVSTGTTFQLEVRRQKLERTRLILTAITAVASAFTAYAAVRRIN